MAIETAFKLKGKIPKINNNPPVLGAAIALDLATAEEESPGSEEHFELVHTAPYFDCLDQKSLEMLDP